jgi:CRP-like cAMP-binding protein
MKELSIGPGEYLFRAGEFDDRLYILVSGQIDLHFEKSSSHD